MAPPCGSTQARGARQARPSLSFADLARDSARGQKRSRPRACVPAHPTRTPRSASTLPCARREPRRQNVPARHCLECWDAHRRPRALHDGSCRPAGLSRAADLTDGEAVEERREHQRRRDTGVAREGAAEADGRARDRPDAVLADGVGDGASLRKRAHQPSLDRGEQRPDAPGVQAVPEPVRRRLLAARSRRA